MQFTFDKYYKAVVIGGSAGSFPVITKVLSQLPENFNIPILMSMHRLKHVRHGFLEALMIKSAKKVIEPHDKEGIKKGFVYLAPANYHMCIELGHTISLSTEEMVNNSRPGIDLTFDTCAYTYKDKLVGILLSGANKDGAMGMKKVKDKGGMTVIQDPAHCVIDTMPNAAKALTEIDYSLTVDEIIEFLHQLNESNEKILKSL